MKVGIVTLPLHTNYGGILQAWALQTVIERMGHASSHMFRHLLGPLVLYKDMTDAEIAAFQRCTARFIDRYIRCDETPLGEIAPDRYDALVVGSDQIWRNRYTDFFHIGLRNAFLDFAAGWNVRRIAYAPSFGIDSWEAPESEIPVCSALLKKFDAVSCREASGVKICRDVLGVDATLVPHPTLLLDRADYAALVDADETVAPSGDLMAYVLDRDDGKNRLLNAVAARFGLRPFSMNDHPDGKGERVQLALKEMLGDRPNVVLAELRNDAKTPSSPRNYGMTFATAKYVGFLDGDDSYRPDCLAECVRNYFFDCVYGGGERPAELSAPDGAFFSATEVDNDYSSILHYALLDRDIDQVVAATATKMLKMFRLLETARAAVLGRLSAVSPARGAEVRAALDDFDAGRETNLARRLWPKLGRIVACGSGSHAQARAELRRFTGDVVWNNGSVFLPEMVVAHAEADESDRYVFDATGCFCEFFQNDSDDVARPVTQSELEAGHTYNVIVTNGAGLYRVVTDIEIRVIRSDLDGLVVEILV